MVYSMMWVLDNFGVCSAPATRQKQVGMFGSWCILRASRRAAACSQSTRKTGLQTLSFRIRAIICQTLNPDMPKPDKEKETTELTYSLHMYGHEASIEF